MISRRDFLKGSLLLAGYTLGVPKAIASALTYDDTKVRSITLKIQYTTEILKPPRRGPVQLWIPLPFDDQEQQIRDLKITAPVKYRFTVSGPNRMVYLKADTLKKGDKVVMEFVLTRRATGVLTIPEEPYEQYLKPSEWEKWDSNITDFVDRVVGREKDPVRIARKIYDALLDRLTYIHEVCGRGVSTIAFEEKAGRCDEFHALFRSMMMYRGIPVKWEQGIAFPYPSKIKKTGMLEADCINAHSWVRFYIGEGRWFPVDVSEAKRRPELRDFYFGRLPADRMRVSTGRGLILDPPQQGIINTFAYTYVEAGGLPVIYGHNYRNIINYEVLAVEV